MSTVIDMKMHENGSLYGIGGADFHLLQILSSYLPFRYELMIRADFNFGGLNDKGEWTGIIGMLKSGEADMAVSRLAQTPLRAEVVDFSFPYLLDPAVFVTAAPGIKQADFPFIEPFHFVVWCFLLLSLPISSVIIYLLSCPKRRKETLISAWMHESYKLMALLLSQGSYASYQKTRVQVFMYIWVLSKLVLVFSYCSILLSFLMVPRLEAPLRTVHELKEAVVSGKYQFTTFKGTSLMTNLNEAEIGVFKVLGEHIRAHPENVLTAEVNAFAQILSKQRLAVLMSRSYATQAQRMMEYGLHRFYVPEDNFGHIPCCVVMRKGLGIVERINRIIHRVTECGLFAKEVEHQGFRLRLKHTKAAQPDTSRSLSLTDMQTAIQLLGAGLLAGACCLIGEICIHRRKTSRKKGRRRKVF